MRKGQGAMEYLMTYGWAILIVIIVGIVLWQSGVFGVQSGGITGFQGGIAVTDYSASAGTNTLTIYVQNVAGEPLKSISVSGDCTNASAGNLATGKDKLIPLTCGTTWSSGDSFTVDLTITYNSTVSKLQKIETGTITGTVS